MMAKFPLLSEEECDQIVAELNGSDGSLWLPGHTPNPEYGPAVKLNLEQPMGETPAADNSGKFIVDKLLACKFFIERTLPKHLGRPRFNLYQEGGEYRRHADAAFMGNSPEIRTDISMTVFLSDPASYDGGELVLEYTSGAVMQLKEPKGMVVFYPSGVMHYVKPVHRGQRIAFVCWVESHIQDPQKRDILVEITELCNQLGSTEEQGSNILTRAVNVKHNLFRQWMKTA